jgi:hypothetical protein
MAFIRNCILIAVIFCCIVTNASAQTVYYPAQSSQLLKATADDAAMLFQKAIAGSRFTTQAYTTIPASGIIFIYDSSISDNQACKVESNGSGYIKFSAAQDNGLHFGLYQYLQQLGFRFYQPGSIWEITPALVSSYSKTDTIFNTAYKYKTWFVSGGHRRWIMDNNTAYDWDGYNGENGHNWALYQRRNGMLGSASFRGHRGDLMTGSYLATLQNNPCYVANYNGSRQAGFNSVPDIFNSDAVNLWATTIAQKHTQSKNIILNNPALYVNAYRNLDYGAKYIGIEVPDGAKWGNSKENEVCSAVDYPKESDQQFTLANLTAQKILATNPNAHFQLYAYSGHADVPSVNISINKNIDIQLIPTVYQLESSTNGLRNRWYNRSSNISEYLYLNLSGWSGETPSFNWSELKATLQIAKDKKSQGIVWEASPAKFGSLPYLLAANNNLVSGTSVDSTLHEFCNNMFAGAAGTIYNMMQFWGDTKTSPDKYSMQLYLQMMHTAVQQTQSAPEVVKERLRELKAYLHYMVLYFNLSNDDRDKTPQIDKDAVLCMYLAKANKMQLVNSYYLISATANKYAATSDFYAKYNVSNGTAYQNGNLPLLTAAEIDADFLNDLSSYGNTLDAFKTLNAAEIKTQFVSANLVPLTKINTSISYTNGANYYGKSTFNIIAPAAGSFSIQYNPVFNIPGKGYINFVVESADNALQVIKDFSLDNNSTAGTLTVQLPAAGKYILSIVSKYKSSVELSITTNGNYFYKEGAFLGNKIENYRADITSLPGYFLIPEGISKVYFSISNSFSNGKYASAETVGKTFNIKDNNGNIIMPRFVTPKDSSLFYLEIPATAAGTFWQATNMVQYNLQFVNISNVLWYAQHKNCTSSVITVNVINEKGNCTTRLSTTTAATKLLWEITDLGQTYKYSNQSVVDLPANISPNASISLTNAGGCITTKILTTDAAYLRDKQACASAAPVATVSGISVNSSISSAPVLFPNPSNGVFNYMQKGSSAAADDISIYTSQGAKVGSFKNVRQFNISNATSGIYLYQITVGGRVYKGKLVKL